MIEKSDMVGRTLPLAPWKVDTPWEGFERYAREKEIGIYAKGCCVSLPSETVLKEGCPGTLLAGGSGDRFGGRVFG